LSDLEQIRRTYANMSDAELLRLAVHEADGLLPEAVTILAQELQTRGAAPEFYEAISGQRAPKTPVCVEELLSAVRAAACPSCARTSAPLNAYQVTEVRSYLLFCSIKRELAVGCPDCIRAMAWAANRTTLIYGWWSFPGPMHCLLAFRRNRRALHADTERLPTPELQNFVAQKPGKATLLARGCSEDTLESGHTWGR
jgi:hypothetical protein